jgi:hypothetical protein
MNQYQYVPFGSNYTSLPVTQFGEYKFICHDINPHRSDEKQTHSVNTVKIKGQTYVEKYVTPLNITPVIRAVQKRK